jgi:ketosteroid isomerase-like protein
LTDSEEVVRSAFEAFATGDLETLLPLVDPDLEWTYLDWTFEDPEPQTCHGREVLAERIAVRPGFPFELDELEARGDRVLVVTRGQRPGSVRRSEEDRNYHVVELRNGRISVLTACRDREEAVAALESP